MKEKLCPICRKVIRSDADIHESCTLCGMGIPAYLSAPRYRDKYGKISYFCCYRCLSIYETKIAKLVNSNQSKLDGV
ncbi:MAG: hypothetical protein ACFFBY_00105 [Promethearchaeota archaeon]